MATTALQHPSHDHPLVPLEFSNDSIAFHCDLCDRKILANGYTCQECKFCVHGVCAEAPPRIDRHPLHPDHNLTLVHRPQLLRLYACNLCLVYRDCLFRCDECDFNLDPGCALSTLPDWGRFQGKTPEQIDLPLHPHQLTSFSTRHDFVGDSDCVICKASVEGDGYVCLLWKCEFLIHKRCIQDLYYADGTKAPRVYHGHQLETFLGEDMGSSICAKCRSHASSGEFIGCARCEVFIHRDCIQVPEIIQYPHHPDHTLVLFINCPDNDKPRCDSCSLSLEGKLCYGCHSCEFFVDVGCALQVLAYCEEGMSAEIELSWHEHPLLLCHGIESDSGFCSYCEDKSVGPMYSCKEKGCVFLLHRRCIEVETTINHPYHPDHPLTLRNRPNFWVCKACCEVISRLDFSCEACAFYLHAKCAAHVPTRKHYLHEHELLHLDKALSWQCNRCGTSTHSPFFRCVPCNFNLHEKCMELPRVVNSVVHWHRLTLHESYVEDDSGEYYCDHCERERDVRLGVYVCEQCTARWVYHIECVLPELRKVCATDHNAAAIERLEEEIARREEDVRAAERKLDEMKRELDELRQKRAVLTLENRITRFR